MAGHPTIQSILNRRLPFGLRPVLFLVSLLIGTAVVYAYATQIEEVVTVPGVMTWSSPKIVISSPDLAVVETTEVDVAQAVRKGDVLATVHFLEAEATYRSLQVEAAQGQAHIERLLAEQNGGEMPAEPTQAFLDAVAKMDAPDLNAARIWADQHELFLSRRQLHERARETVQANVAKLQQQAELGHTSVAQLETRLPLYAEIEGMRKSLADTAAGSRLTYLQSMQDRLAAESQVIAARRATVEAETELARENGRLQAIEENWQTDIGKELEDARSNASLVAARLTVEANRARLTNIVAPTDAIILERADRAPGSVVQKGERLFTMIPRDGTANVRLMIPAGEIAQLHGHEAVRIKFTSLPFQRHGYLDGRLETVATDAMPVSEGDQQRTEPIYYANASVSPDRKLVNVPDDFKLLPGMPLFAEIIVGSRPLYTYFTYPLQQAASRALRESQVGPQ